MTAEIIVLNRGAIAMAADSAVTVSGAGERKKVFNSANKLMMLSERAPVAVMIYDYAELLGMPWETLVKTFRRNLGRETYAELTEYADNFLLWLSKEVSVRLPTQSHTAFEEFAFKAAIMEARDRGLNQVRAVLQNRAGLSRLSIQRTLAVEIREFLDAIQQLPYYDGWDEKRERRLKRVWTPHFDALRHEVFEQLPLSDTSIRRINQIGLSGLTRVGGPSPTTGLVVAGFGDDQVFPAVSSYKVSGVLDGAVRSFADTGTSFVGNVNTGSMIIPFAQREMVATFVEGIDPELTNFLNVLLRQTLEGVPSAFIAGSKGISNQDAKNLETALKNTMSDVLSEVLQGLADYRNSHHVEPVLDIVNHMPKEELAALAEALVSLTSLKRKVTMVPETVGGPIDVAVISKGDGFVWIRRKHYFDQSLNPRFVADYYRQ